MTTDRYELRADHTDWLDVRDPQGYRNTINQPGAVALIRQQARDIAELEVFAEIGRQWNADSSLAKWFPLTAERVEQDAQEIAKLRTDLAAAVADRDRLLKLRDTCEHCDGTGDVHTPTGEWRGECDCVYAQNNQLRAFKSTVEAAYTVADVIAGLDGGKCVHERAFGLFVPDVGTELIARPAKDQT